MGKKQQFCANLMNNKKFNLFKEVNNHLFMENI